jgi:hypothetical protein
MCTNVIFNCLSFRGRYVTDQPQILGVIYKCLHYSVTNYLFGETGGNHTEAVESAKIFARAVFAKRLCGDYDHVTAGLEMALESTEEIADLQSAAIEGRRAMMARHSIVGGSPAGAGGRQYLAITGSASPLGTSE